MPVWKDEQGNWRMGSSKNKYSSKKKAENAYQAYLAIKHDDEKKKKKK